MRASVAAKLAAAEAAKSSNIRIRGVSAPNVPLSKPDMDPMKGPLHPLPPPFAPYGVSLTACILANSPTIDTTGIPEDILDLFAPRKRVPMTAARDALKAKKVRHRCFRALGLPEDLPLPFIPDSLLLGDIKTNLQVV